MVFDPSTIPDSQKIQLTCDSSPISSDQTDFPLTVVLDGADPLHAGLFTNLGSNSKRLSIESGTTQCPVEIESWDSVAEKAVLHTKVPTYTAASDPELVLSYDNSQPDNTDYVGDAGETKPTLFTGLQSTTMSGVASYTRRFVIPSSEITSHEGKKQIVFQHHGTDYTLGSVYVMKKAASGDEYDGQAGTVIQLTMGGETTFTVTSSNNVSDPVDIDTSDGIILSCYSTSSVPYNSSLPTNCVLYYKSGVDEAATEDVTGYSTGTTQAILKDIIGLTPSQSVWDSNFVGVWHMAQDPSGGADCILDSTANGYHLTPNGSMTSGDLVDGLHGKALEFDGSNDFLQRNTFPFGSTNTIEVLGVVNDNAGSKILAYQINDNAGLAFFVNSSGIIEFDGRTDTASTYYSAEGTLSYESADVWNYFVGVRESGVGWSVDVNGGEDTGSIADTTTGSIYSGTYFTIGAGRYNNGSASNFLPGRISEVRISNVARSADWIKLTNLSLRNQLITWSAYTSSPGLPGWDNNKKLKLTFDSPGSDLTDVVVSVPLGTAVGKNSFDASRVFDEIAPQWTPAEITTNLWLDAFDETTLVTSGSDVTQWNDKSGNGVNFSSTLANDPQTGTLTLNSKNVIQFQGNARLENASSFTQPITYFVVGKAANATDAFIDGLGSSYRNLVGLNASGYLQMYAGNALSDSTDRRDTDLLISAVFNSSSSSGYINGTSVLSGGAGTDDASSGLVIGDDQSGNNELSGYIAEIIAIEGTPDEETRQTVEGYLAHKWGLEANLPSDHPYKAFPPGVNPLKVAFEIGDTQTQAYAELEHYDSVAEKALYHVRIPSALATTQPVLNLYYDSTHADNDTYVGIIGSTPGQEVWNDGKYVAVYHMAQDPSTGTDCLLDSTANANHMSSGGSMTVDDLVDGLFGKAIEFDGNDRFSLSGFQAPASNNITVEGFYYPTGWGGGGGLPCIFASWDSVNSFFFGIDDGDTETAGDVRMYIDSNDAVSATPLSLDTWSYIAGKYDGSTITNNVDGSTDGTLSLSATMNTGSSTAYMGVLNSSNTTNGLVGKLSEVRVSNIARLDEELAYTNNSLRDNLITWSEPDAGGVTILVNYCDLTYSMFPTEITKNYVDLVYSLNKYLVNFADLVYGLRLTNYEDLPYGDNPVIRAFLDMPYGDRLRLIRYIDLLYGDRPRVQQYVDLEYSIFKTLKNYIDMRYSISAKSLRQHVDLKYDIQLRSQMRNFTDLIYGIAADNKVKQTSLQLYINGSPIKYNLFSYEYSFDQYCIQAEVHTTDQSVYLQIEKYVTELRCVEHDGEHRFVAEQPRKMRKPGETVYVLPFVSKSVKLEKAETITKEYPAGMASSLVAGIAGDYDIIVSWETLDWFIPSGTLIANNETPLQIIRKVTQAIGAKIQSDRDGDIRVIRRYKYNPSALDSVPIDFYFDDGDFQSTGETPEDREGHNKFLVSDHTVPSENTWLVTEDVGSFEKTVKGFRVPFDTSSLVLKHSGGSWVSIVSNGLVYETIEKEIVEIVEGKGSCSNPIYGLIGTPNYKQVNLGTITYSEDGTLSTQTKGQSLVEITYVTQYYSWRVTDYSSEKVQFYLEVE